MLRNFTPDQVESAVNSQMAEPSWNNRLLYQGVLDALESLEGRLRDKPRSIDLLSGRVVEQPGLTDVQGGDIEKAIRELASASQGGMTVDGYNVLVHVSLDELRRRVSSFVGSNAAAPRRLSSFRDS